MNTRMGARPCAAQTQYHYAAMLIARAAPGDREKALALLTQALDTAQELGMRSLVEKAMALKVRAEGIASGALPALRRALLGSFCATFTGGFDTRALHRGEALLEELA